MKNDGFLGAWDVEEKIYDPQGQLIGEVLQKRLLFDEGSTDRLRVVQTCQPSASLSQHPMSAFAGTFEFWLQRKGSRRFYLGPDVEGSAWTWGDAYLSGEGLWPKFGYNFRSWSAKVSTRRQLTGGIFYRGAEVIAVVLGTGTATHAKTAGEDAGEQQEARGQRESCRLLVKEGLEEKGQNLDTHVLNQLEANEGEFYMERTRINGTALRGFAKAYGPLLLWDVFSPSGVSLHGLDVRDVGSQMQFSIRREFRHGQLESIEAVKWTEQKQEDSRE